MTDQRRPRVSKLDGFKEHLLSRLGSHPACERRGFSREIRGRGFDGGYET